jgi:hypothetical protein
MIILTFWQDIEDFGLPGNKKTPGKITRGF